MKNLSISIFLAVLASSISLQGQSTNFANLKKNALTVSPYQAFTKNGEMKIGYEKQQSSVVALELNLGFRFKGSDTPQIDPYFSETLVSSELRKVRNGSGYIFFIPYKVNGNVDNWTEKTERSEYYITHNLYVSGGYKLYVAKFKNKQVPGGLYFTPGIILGNRGITAHVYANGQNGYMRYMGVTRSVKEFDFLSSFTGTERDYQEDIYDFSSIEIKKYTKTYLRPHLKLGVQFPIASRFSLDLGIQATFQRRWDGHSFNSPVIWEPAAKLGVWF